MAEKLVSPGVFTRENDLSFLQQGVANIGAAFIGPFLEGPVVPTIVNSQAEFETLFGKADGTYYTPLAVQNYLKEAGTATICRVAGINGYTEKAPLLLTATNLGEITSIQINGTLNNYTSSTGTNTGTAPLVFAGAVVSGSLSPAGYVTIATGSITSVTLTEKGSGILSVTSSQVYISQSVLATHYNTTGNFNLTYDLATSASVGILFNGINNYNAGFSGASITASAGGDFVLNTNSGSIHVSSSLDPKDGSNIEAVFGTNINGWLSSAYSYAFFKNSNVTFDTYTSASVTVLGDQSFTFDANEANTPYIKSQLIGGNRINLFQFETIGVGNSTNTKVKIGISNIKAAGTINGTDYGVFTVTVRDFNDTDKKKIVLETFANVNLDPNSPNFISRVIGDRYLSIDNFGKITETGDWVNNSKYIRVSGLNTNAPIQAVPFGHAAYTLPISASTALSATIPVVTFSTGSIAQSGSTALYAGIDLDNNTDNGLYLKPIPNGAGVGSNTVFGLDSIATPLQVGDTRAQFIVAFQGGFDGMNPATKINLGTDISAGNSQGFNLTNVNSSGSVAYMKVINALSNADEWDINMIVAPGVIQSQHSYIANALVDLAEQRSDAFLLLDSTLAGDSVAQAVIQASALDTNYAASYYPWIKTIDVNTNKLITVPPSVLLPGVFAANDRVAAEWFAPAGLNRGGLTGAVSVLNRLTQSEKDTLYDGKVNPIVQFPGQGIVVFGQKTLQDKPSALDRINVRRLLLTVRKYIASTSKYLVFEQNTATTRNAFLNIVNPYLSNIQQRQGLYAFRVVMDESNNTPDVIDRNIMKGAIYLQPTKTAEFIQIDFNILPTGATFNG